MTKIIMGPSRDQTSKKVSIEYEKKTDALKYIVRSL